MILKNMGTHYEATIFDVVIINKDNPLKSWLEYVKDKTKELEHEVTRTVYPAKGLLPVQGHIVVPNSTEGEKGVLDGIKKTYDVR